MHHKSTRDVTDSLSKNVTSKSFSPPIIEQLHLRSISPPIARHSPITVTTTSRYESTTRNVHSSSPSLTTSKLRRDSASPSGAGPSGTTSHFITHSTHRVGSPQTTSFQRLSTASPLHLRAASPAAPPLGSLDRSYKVTEETSTYKKTNNVVSSATLDRQGSPSYVGHRNVTASASGKLITNFLHITN